MVGHGRIHEGAVGVHYSERAEFVLNLLFIVYIFIAAELEGSLGLFLVVNDDKNRVISGLQGHVSSYYQDCPRSAKYDLRII